MAVQRGDGRWLGMMFCHSLGSERATTATTGILETLILSLSKDERSSQAVELRPSLFGQAPPSWRVTIL